MIDFTNIPFSIVIPSYNGAQRLPKLLNALELLTLPPLEVIVVIDGSTDNTLEILKNWKGIKSLKIIDQENKGRAGARNSGANAALGDFIIFYDDDMEPSKTSAERHLQLLSTYSNSISAGQQLEKLDDKSEFGQYKSYLTQKWVSGLGDEIIKLSREKLFLIAANMGIKKSDFIKLGGFDEALRDAEDYDLAIRALEFNLSVYFDPQNLSTHVSFSNFTDYIIRRREYNKGQEKLIELRKAHIFSPLYLKYSPKPKTLNRFIYFFVPPHLVKLIEKNGLKWIPLKYRYKIYDRIISALSIYFPQRSLKTLKG